MAGLSAVTAMAVAAAVWAGELVRSFGYAGIFFASFVGSASVLLPVPSFVIVSALGAVMNPWLVGISAGLGSAVGEMVGYAVGRGGGKLIESKYKDWIKKYSGWFKHKRMFLLVFIFAATPLPDDIVGILCGMFKYDAKKFLLASILGKCVLNTVLAFAGFYGAHWIAAALEGGL